MAISEFPLPSVSGSNPIPSVWYQLPERFQGGFTAYDDGGRDTRQQNGGNGIKRWVLNYAVIPAAQAAILDSHAYAAKLMDDGLSAQTFSYRDRDGTLYAGVRYQQYERPAHVKSHIQFRNVILVKYP